MANKNYFKLSFVAFLMLFTGSVTTTVVAGHSSASEGLLGGGTADVKSVSGIEQQQTKAIKGTVKDTDGIELTGVTVRVKGTTVGVVTDLDGKYMIEVPDGGVLQFSYIGFLPQEVKVGSQSTIDIELKEDAKALEEVVVVGYSTQKKADLTGAVASVKMDNLNDMAVGGINSALQGRMSGVTVLQSSGAPGAGTSIRIRGMGTLGNNEPLYVIDGMAADNMNDVNPTDIERIDVLKDAASAAIYGSRAANGVVLIQTKKGKDTGKINVSLNTYHGVSMLRKKIDVLNAAERNMIHLEAYDNDLASGRIKPLNPSKPDDFQNQYTTPTAYYRDPSSAISRTNWQDEVFNDAYMGNYDLSLSGASKIAKYNVMAGHLTQDGILKNTSFERTSFRINTEFELIKNLVFGENLMISHSKKKLVQEMGQAGAITTALQFDPAVPVYDPTGENLYSGSGELSSDIRNPVGVVDRADRQNIRDRVFGNVYLQYTFLNDFVIKTDFGYDKSQLKEKWFVGKVPENARSSASNELSIREWDDTRWQNTTTLSYNKSVAGHKIMVMGGHSYEQFKSDWIDTRGTKFLSEDPSQRYMGAATEIAWLLGGRDEWALESYFGRLDYSFSDRYLLAVNFRADGTSRFSKSNRWSYFPSVSAGWRISEEKFFEPLKQTIDQLKLRASWGKLGNQNIGNTFYPTKSIILNTINDDGYYVSFGGDEGRYIGRYASNLANPDIKWETTTQTDIGLDLTFLGKFDFGFDYYIKKSKDVLIQLPLTSLIGVEQAPWVNAADVDNKGFDINLSYNTQVNDWSIGAYGNIGSVKNKVVSTGSASKAIYPTSYRAQNITRITAGESIGHFYGYKTDGIFKSQAEIDSYVGKDGTKIQPNAVIGDVKFIDLDGDGKLNSNDQTNIGSGFPDFTYGFGADIGYKGFDLSLFFQGVAGAEIFNAQKYEGMFVNRMYNQFSEILDRYHPTANPGGSLPSVSINNNNGNHNISDMYVENGDYLRLKTITFGYTFDKKLTRKFHLQKLRVYATAQNLLTFTGYKGFDPELGETNANELAGKTMEIGVDRGQFPQPKSFIVGVNINF